MSESRHHQQTPQASAFSASGVLAAGAASACAAVVTSRFGVAGTLLGAALTTMIITGVSAVVKSYLQTLTGRVQKVPEKLRSGRMRRQSGRSSLDLPVGTLDPPPATRVEPGGMTVYGRRREGFVGKLRSAFGWFSGLPGRRKRSVLVGAAIPAILAIVVAFGAITSVEFLSGRTLSCLTSGECQTASASTGGSATSSSKTSLGYLASRTQGGSSGTQQNDQQIQTPAVRNGQNVQPQTPSGVSGSGGSGGSGSSSNSGVPGWMGGGSGQSPGSGGSAEPPAVTPGSDPDSSSGADSGVPGSGSDDGSSATPGSGASPSSGQPSGSQPSGSRSAPTQTPPASGQRSLTPSQ